MNKQKRCREIFRLSEEMPVQYICRVIFLSKRVVKLVTLSL